MPAREADADHGNRVECAPCSEPEFLFRSKRGGVINVARIEVWDDAHQTLLLCSSYLLGGDQFGGSDRHLDVLPSQQMSETLGTS